MAITLEGVLEKFSPKKSEEKKTCYGQCNGNCGTEDSAETKTSTSDDVTAPVGLVHRRYVRKAKRTPKGLMVAYIDPTTKKIMIGFALCHSKDMSDFNSNFGYELAMERAVKFGTRTQIILGDTENERPGYAMYVIDGDECFIPYTGEKHVTIPKSMKVSLEKFCRSMINHHFKGYELVEWAQHLLKDTGSKFGSDGEFTIRDSAIFH